MNAQTIALLSLTFLANAASAQSLYLTCKATAFPDLDFKRIYKAPPPEARKQFIRDMAEEGLLGVLVNKAESWEIKIGEATVASPEENSGPKFFNATIAETKISATATSPRGTNYSYELNRITGTLTYRVYLTEETMKSWHSKHGGSLPSTWKWEQSCTSSDKLKS